jgi:uncharacterized protein YecE (DUF72 family)
VGTSGWHYADWRGRFYPTGTRTGDWLAHYAERFPTVELNNSFYRLPTASAFDRWGGVVPDGFVFAVKASRYITHIKRLDEPAPAVTLLWDRARHLGPHLGPLLFQLPPTLQADPERLAALLRALPRGARAALEFRHASWMRDEVFELLDEHGAALVWADGPGARLRWPVTGGWAYLRFHRGRREEPGYAREKLRRWADRIAGLPASVVYAFFNNDERGAAVEDARSLSALVSERGVAVPTAP